MNKLTYFLTGISNVFSFYFILNNLVTNNIFILKIFYSFILSLIVIGSYMNIYNLYHE